MPASSSTRFATTVGAERFTHLVGGLRTFALRTRGRQNEGEWGRATPWPGVDALRRLRTAATTHRTEITVALTHLGIEHPELDGLEVRRRRRLSARGERLTQRLQ